MHGYPFSHINVWVRRRGEHHADAARALLFIECSNDCEGMKDASFLCTIVSESSKDAGRCFHCERAGTKIVHPALGSYHGQRGELKLMASGEHSETNDSIVSFGKRMTVFVDAKMEEDFIYCDPIWDANSAMIINYIARMRRGTRMRGKLGSGSPSKRQTGARNSLARRMTNLPLRQGCNMNP